MAVSKTNGDRHSIQFSFAITSPQKTCEVGRCMWGICYETLLALRCIHKKKTHCTQTGGLASLVISKQRSSRRLTPYRAQRHHAALGGDTRTHPGGYLVNYHPPILNNRECQLAIYFHIHIYILYMYIYKSGIYIFQSNYVGMYLILSKIDIYIYIYP